MKKIVVTIVLILAGICIAPTYKTNIGVHQKDTADTASSPSYFWNIGVDQTDAPGQAMIITTGDD